MSEPLVSAIVTTHFPRAIMLKRAINSVLAQTFRNFEIIVVDSGHYPESEAAVTSLNNACIRFHRTSRTKNCPATRNEGLLLARGRYIAFLDDDNEWLPAKLEKQINVFRTSNLQDLGMVTCPIWIVDDAKSRMRPEPWFGQLRRGCLLNEALNLSFDKAISASPTAMLYMKEVFTGGLWDENLLCGEDWDLIIRLAQKWQIDFVPEPLALCHYNYSGPRATARANEIASHKLLLQKHHDLLSTRPRALARHWLLLAYDYFRAKERKQCHANVWQAVKHDPHIMSAWMLLLASLTAPGFWAYRAFLDLRSGLAYALLGKAKPSAAKQP